MELDLHNIPIREVAAGYADDSENGCVGYGGRLNIRPAFQREFIYNDSQRKKVIETVKKKFPLNVMYWVKSADGNFEMLDGQQRTISICQYVNGDFRLDDYQSFSNFTKDERDEFLDYKLMIYICEGNDREKLDWFETINIAGEKLTPQEMRNAIWACEWLTDAKKFFSKNNCPVQVKYSSYLKGSAIRQDYLETALKWIADRDKLKHLEIYMDAQKANKVDNCAELWNYFEDVFKWVQKIFPTYRANVMKGLEWGIFYNRYGKNDYDAAKLDKEISRLLKDFDVTNKRGIYEYLLGGKKNERLLSIRQFDARTKTAVYERQKGLCKICGKHFELNEMHADHVKAWSKGGATVADNCQMLCRNCNLKKSAG